MMQLKKYQQNAVDRLLEYTAEALQTSKYQEQILLEAPTGAGKTVVAASYLSQLIDYAHNLSDIRSKDLSFIWIAPNTLHLQSYNSLKGFFSTLNDIKVVKVDDLAGEVHLNSNEMLFLNWSSVDKEKNIFRAENERNYNLQSLVDNTRAKGNEIILIIDEAHWSAFTGPQAIKVRNSIRAKIEIAITATPKSRPAKSCVITRQEAIREEMIKKGVKLNPQIVGNSTQDLDYILLKAAVAKRDELEQTYKKLGVDINPLLLIQLPSENMTTSAEDESKRAKIEAMLQTEEFNISRQNGLLSVWLSGEKDKDGIESPNALQKAMIFKQAVAQGWNCPRAAVLLIYREIGSRQFGLQTVGRILRMPEQKYYEDEALNYGYVYSNLQNNIIEFVADEYDYFEKYASCLKDNIEPLTLPSEYIINDRESAGFLKRNFTKIFFSIAEERLGISQIPEEEMLIANYMDNCEVLKENRAAFVSAGWSIEPKNIVKGIPVDVYIDEYDRQSLIVAEKIEGFAETPMQLLNIFESFCYTSISKLNKSKSWKVLRETLECFAEYYLGLYDIDMYKFVLGDENNAKVEQLIQISLEHYDDWQNEQENIHKRVEGGQWSLPNIRYYSDSNKEVAMSKHALTPYYRYRNASLPELEFEEFLEHKATDIDWWYKNGSSGRDNFSIAYRNTNDVLSLFYPDYIIKFSDGRLGIFDTKSNESDQNAPQKHNALIDYIEKQSINIVGGVIIKDLGGFRFSKKRIDNTTSCDSWDYL